jgi:hypothetical protein
MNPELAAGRNLADVETERRLRCYLKPGKMEGMACLPHFGKTGLDWLLEHSQHNLRLEDTIERLLLGRWPSDMAMDRFGGRPK